MRTIEGAGKLKRDIGLRLTLLARLLRNDFDKRVAEHGITRSQWGLLAVIAGRPGASQREIAELLEMTEAAVGRAIEKACNEGLLERRAREDDKRAREVFLTPASHKILETIGEIARSREAEVFAGFDDQRLMALRESLEQIYTNVSKATSPFGRQ